MEPARLHATAKALRDADPKIYKALRAGIRTAGDDTVEDIRSEIGQVPSKSGRGIVRGALKAGTRVSISVASPKSSAVTLVTDPRHLPASKRPLAAAFNKDLFRRPIWGGRGGWTVQRGHPYFQHTIMRNQPAMTTAVWRELTRAEQTIGRGI